MAHSTRTFGLDWLARLAVAALTAGGLLVAFVMGSSLLGYVERARNAGSQTQFAAAQIAPASTAAAAQVAQTQPPPQRRLPQTGTALPSIGVVGLLIAAFGALLLFVTQLTRVVRTWR